MNQKKRDTALKIESALDDLLENGAISKDDRFRQLIYIVYDYLEGEDIPEAIRVLHKIDFEFFSTIPPLKKKKDEYSKIAIKIYNHFGLEFCIPEIKDAKN